MDAAYGWCCWVRERLASRLHALADEIEALPLEGAAEVLSWLGDQIEGLLREADRILSAQGGRYHET